MLWLKTEISLGPSSLKETPAHVESDLISGLTDNVSELHLNSNSLTRSLRSFSAEMPFHVDGLTSALPISSPHIISAIVFLTLDITQWHTRQSSPPLVYLGYPICTCQSQRSVTFHQICGKVQAAYHIHSQRQLSIRGRATVLKLLIFSMLWHILRLFTCTQHQLFCLGIHGGFQLFNISTNKPLFNGVGCIHLCSFQIPTLVGDNSLCLSFLKYTLNWFYSSHRFPGYLWFLLFPSCCRAF